MKEPLGLPSIPHRVAFPLKPGFDLAVVTANATGLELLMGHAALKPPLHGASRQDKLKRQRVFFEVVGRRCRDGGVSAGRRLGCGFPVVPLRSTTGYGLASLRDAGGRGKRGAGLGVDAGKPLRTSVDICGHLWTSAVEV